MSEIMSDYIPPEGWRVKSDDELVQSGDRFTHDDVGCPFADEAYAYESIGAYVGNTRKRRMPHGGYILTPIVLPSTPQPDVSQEPQTDDMDGWEIYEPVDGHPYSSGAEWAYPSDPSSWWPVRQLVHFSSDYRIDYLYRRPKQQPARKPLDVHLPEI